MSKYLILLVFMFYTISGGGTPIAPIVTIEDEIITGVSLPEWGTVCVATEVRGGPGEEYASTYSVGVGTRVRLHDQSRPNGDWVSIKAARWIPLAALCN